MKRMTIQECQEVYDKYGIDCYEHTGLTTDLCMVISKLEDAARSALIALNQVPNTEISGKYKKTYEVCSMLDEVLKVKTFGDDDDEN